MFERTIHEGVALLHRRHPWFRTIAFLILLFGSHHSPRGLSQPITHGSAPTLDASELAPAPSTWKGAIADSFRLLLLEHTTGIAFQKKTRRELGGPFFSDYIRSVRMPNTWGDGDGWRINYVGHPIHGAASGFIWLDHEDGAHDPKLGFSKEYWTAEPVPPPGLPRKLSVRARPPERSIDWERRLAAKHGWLGRSCRDASRRPRIHDPRGCGRLISHHATFESRTGNRLIRALLRSALNPAARCRIRPRRARRGRGPSGRFARGEPTRRQFGGLVQNLSPQWLSTAATETTVP